MSVHYLNDGGGSGSGDQLVGNTIGFCEIFGGDGDHLVGVGNKTVDPVTSDQETFVLTVSRKIEIVVVVVFMLYLSPKVLKFMCTSNTSDCVSTQKNQTISNFLKEMFHKLITKARGLVKSIFKSLFKYLAAKMVLLLYSYLFGHSILEILKSFLKEYIISEITLKLGCIGFEHLEHCKLVPIAIDLIGCSIDLIFECVQEYFIIAAVSIISSPFIFCSNFIWKHCSRFTGRIL